MPHIRRSSCISHGRDVSVFCKLQRKRLIARTHWVKFWHDLMASRAMMQPDATRCNQHIICPIYSSAVASDVAHSCAVARNLHRVTGICIKQWFLDPTITSLQRVLVFLFDAWTFVAEMSVFIVCISIIITVWTDGWLWFIAFKWRMDCWSKGSVLRDFAKHDGHEVKSGCSVCK